MPFLFNVAMHLVNTLDHCGTFIQRSYRREKGSDESADWELAMRTKPLQPKLMEIALNRLASDQLHRQDSFMKPFWLMVAQPYRIILIVSHERLNLWREASVPI